MKAISIIKNGTYLGDIGEVIQTYVEKNISFHSNCEHHFLPIIGKAHIAYISSGNVIGLSKLHRIVNYSNFFHDQLTPDNSEIPFSNIEIYDDGDIPNQMVPIVVMYIAAKVSIGVSNLLSSGSSSSDWNITLINLT